MNVIEMVHQRIQDSWDVYYETKKDHYETQIEVLLRVNDCIPIPFRRKSDTIEPLTKKPDQLFPLESHIRVAETNWLDDVMGRRLGLT